jgi:NAD(P)-dependent dehydrogenase (short-subunit alcohol dehydrogenase family)
MRLAEKVAIVTGTSPNIGGGIAEAFAREGAKLVCVDADEQNALDCARWIDGNLGPAIGRRCDVRNNAEVEAVVAAALAEFGRIDILVNGAVKYNMKGLLAMPLEAGGSFHADAGPIRRARCRERFWAQAR